MSSQPQHTTTTTSTTTWQDQSNTTDGSYYPQPPILHDHLRPSSDPNKNPPNPSLILPNQDLNNSIHIPLPPSHPDFDTQIIPNQNNSNNPSTTTTTNPQQQQQQQNAHHTSQNTTSTPPKNQTPLPQPISTQASYHTMPVNDPNKTTIAFDMYIPTQNNPNYHQNSTHYHNHSNSSNCDCCPHHHKRKDGNKTLYRHLKQPTWGQYIKDKAYLSWEFIKQTYWHLEPWVVRPLIAGIAYNIGIQLARVAIQHFFPTFFPTTVYLPLRSNARFYDLHAKRVQQVNVDDGSSNMIMGNGISNGMGPGTGGIMGDSSSSHLLQIGDGSSHTTVSGGLTLSSSSSLSSPGPMGSMSFDGGDLNGGGMELSGV